MLRVRSFERSLWKAALLRAKGTREPAPPPRERGGGLLDQLPLSCGTTTVVEAEVALPAASTQVTVMV